MLNEEQISEIQHLFEEVGDLDLLEYLSTLDLSDNVKEQIKKVLNLNYKVFGDGEYDKENQYFDERNVLLDMLGFDNSSGYLELKTKL